MQTIQQKWIHRIVIPISSISLLAVLFLTQTTIAAPTADAPAGNPPTPINDSSQAQTKAGPLTVNGPLTAGNLSAGTISTTTLCMYGSCRSSWPSASYGTPSLQQVLNYNASAPSRTLFIPSNAGGIDWNGTGYRNRWYKARLVNGYSNYRQLNYRTPTSCQSHEVVCGIESTGGPYAPIPGFYCCPIIIQMVP